MTALMVINLSYLTRDLIPKLDDATYVELCKHLAVEPTEENRKYTYKDYIIDDATAQWLSDHGLSFEVKRFKGTIQLGSRIDPTGAAHSANHVTIHVPNYGLHAVRYVEVIEDCCTDRLQERLDSGWIILAICPPLDARRPDYIVGRVTAP